MAIANDCASILLSHNHPGGSTNPSNEDRNLTQKIVDIFQPLDIKVLDHIIVGGYSFSSMAQNQTLPSFSLKQANYEPIPLKNHEQIFEKNLDYDEEMDEELEP